MIHYISSEWLTIERLEEIFDNKYQIALSDDAITRISHCRSYLDEKNEKSERADIWYYYWIRLIVQYINRQEQLSQLQKNLVMSHSCGVGERVPSEIVKLMLLTKIQSLSYGHSGVQLETVQRLVDFYNNDIIPVVFQQGVAWCIRGSRPSCKHVTAFTRSWEVEYCGTVRPSKEVLDEKGWQPISLMSKEGLALLNGTQFMSSYAVLSVIKSRRLSKLADKIGALSLDAFDGRIEPFMIQIQQVRPHPGATCHCPCHKGNI